MSYNVAESATLTTATSNFTVAQDTSVSYTPDYRIVTVGGVTVGEITVDAGGQLTAKTGGAEVYDATAQSGGVIDLANIDTYRLSAVDGGIIRTAGCDMYNMVVSSGGSAVATGNYVWFGDMNIQAGGTFIFSCVILKETVHWAHV